jgi:hypothetical protein
MKDKSELMLRSSLCNAGYSEEAVDKILGWYITPEKTARPKQRKVKDKVLL